MNKFVLLHFFGPGSRQFFIVVAVFALLPQLPLFSLLPLLLLLLLLSPSSFCYSPTRTVHASRLISLGKARLSALRLFRFRSHHM